MGIAVLPIAVLVVLGLLTLAAWVFVWALRGNRGGRRVSVRYAIVLMACCIALWLGLCFFFMVWASLGHSAHPLRDSWLQCLVSFFILIVTPLALFRWRAKRRSDKDFKPWGSN
jgi:hypothetical protein